MNRRSHPAARRESSWSAGFWSFVLTRPYPTNMLSSLSASYKVAGNFVHVGCPVALGIAHQPLVGPLLQVFSGRHGDAAQRLVHLIVNAGLAQDAVDDLVPDMFAQ